MLKILDRYIIRKFLSTFFFMLGVIMLLAMVFDLSERLSEFIENKAPLSAIILGYYANFLIYYGNTFSPMIVFISVIWFTAKMAQDTEIIPILNSGRPFTRMLRPYMIGATILMILSFILNHLVLPVSNKTRLAFEEKYYRDNLIVEKYHGEFPNREFVSFENYIAAGNIFNELTIHKYDKNNNLIHFIKARTGSAKPGSHKWLLTDYWERIITVPDEKTAKAAGFEEFAPAIMDTLIEGKMKDTILPFAIEDLAQRDNASEAMGYAELKEFIRKEKSKGNSKVPVYEIELYNRTSFPFATYVLTLIGVSVSSRKKRGGIGVNIAIGLAFVFVYIFAMKVTTVAAIKVGFPPILAVWMPNIIFGFLAYMLYRMAPK